MKRLIVYDLDGTLVDTLEDITRAVNHMAQQFDAPALAADEVRRFVGHGLHQLVKSCLKTDDPRRIERGAKIYRAYYADHLVDHSRLYPGVREVLEHFKGRTQVVVTNKPNPFSRDILHALDVERYFWNVIAGDEEYPKKPDPTAVRSLMDQAGVSPNDTLLIGDSPIDVQTGRSAGVVTVGVLHGFADATDLSAAAPDALVRDFTELLRVANQQAW